MQSRVLVLGSEAEAEVEAEEAKAEQNLEIAFRLPTDTEGWVWGSLEGSPGVNPSGGSPLGGSTGPRVRLA